MSEEQEPTKTCGTCRFLVGSRCHRFPPYAAVFAGIDTVGHWPIVEWESWCGEWAATSGADAR